MWHMAVAARYINRELVNVFVVVALVLVVVAVGGRFVGYLQEAALGKYPADSLLTILWLRLPEFLQQLVPFAFYVAALVAVGRLHAEHEMAVLQGGGVSPARLLGWLWPAAACAAVAVGYLSLVVTPRNTVELDQYLLTQRDRQEFDGVSAGVFRTLQGGKRVTYTETVSSDRQRLGEVFIAEPTAVRPVTVWAEHGSQYVDAETGSQFLLLENGTRYEGRAGTKDYRVVRFAELGQRLAVSNTTLVRIDPEARPTSELAARADPPSRAELQWRLALPVLVLVGVALALGMARAKPRAGRFARVAPGLGLFVGYFLLLVVIKDLVAEGSWPALLGLWPIHLGFAGLAIYLLRRVALPARM